MKSVFLRFDCSVASGYREAKHPDIMKILVCCLASVSCAPLIWRLLIDLIGGWTGILLVRQLWQLALL